MRYAAPIELGSNFATPHLRPVWHASALFVILWDLIYMEKTFDNTSSSIMRVRQIRKATRHSLSCGDTVGIILLRLEVGILVTFGFKLYMMRG